MISTGNMMNEFQSWLSNVMQTSEGRQLLDDLGEAQSEHKKGSQALLGARKAAGEKRLAKDKTVTLDRILKIASVGLPLAGMLTGGKRPGRGALALGALGRTAGGIDTLRTQQRVQQRETEFGTTMGNIEAEQRLLDTGLKSQTGMAQARFDVGQQGFENLLATKRETRLGLPKAPTVGGIKAELLTGFSPEKQEDVLFPERRTPGQLTDLQRGKFALEGMTFDEEDILVRANQKVQSLPEGLRNNLGLKDGILDNFSDLERIAAVLEGGGIDKPGWFTGDYAVNSTLQGLVTDYNELRQKRRGLLRRLSGQGLPGGDQTGKPPDMSDAEWQEYLQLRGQ